MRFADWLCALASAASTKAAHAAEVAESKAVDVVRIQETAKLSAARTAADRAAKQLEAQQRAYARRLADLNAAHPGY